MITTQKYQYALSAVHMVYRLVNSTYNVKELLLRLTRLVCQLIKSSSCSIYLLDETSKKIKLISIYNQKGHVLIEKKADLKRITEQEIEVALGRSIHRHRLIGLPLVADDNIGAIFISRDKKGKKFTEFDREILSVIAEQAVTAIKNLQLYEEQQRIILGSIKSIGKLLEKRTPSVTAHDPAYFRIVKSLAEKLNMGQEQIQNLQYASMLHDAGSIDVPYEILSKSSQLSPEEFQLMRDIPAKSVELIKPVAFLKPVLPIILYHHEKYDGTGYPLGLKKEQIPLGARVMSVVTTFEAMIRLRPYKKALSIPEALGELKRNSGTQFDPVVVKAFTELSKQKKFRNYLSYLED
ncbi:MAG: HD domain-containing phosphohydrolase [Candidatus Omnitrophota bacterium]